MSKQWNRRPSELLDVTDSYASYCLDEACFAFGSACESAMDEARRTANKKATEAQRRGRAENALRKMLGLPMKFRNIGDLLRPNSLPAADLPPPPFKRG